MKNILIKVLEYGTHKSTWAGLVALLAHAGITQIAGVDTTALIDAAVYVFSAAMIFVAERNKDNTDKVEKLLS